MSYYCCFILSLGPNLGLTQVGIFWMESFEAEGDWCGRKARVIGRNKCERLVTLPNFTGTEWSGRFVRISKKVWVAAYTKLEEHNAIISCLQELGNGTLQKELVHNELPPDVSLLESFVCDVYCFTGSRNVPSLRWEVFHTANDEGGMLPPICAALLPHITCAIYITMHDKWYVTNQPTLLPIDQNGWYMEDGMYMPVCCLILPAPRAVIEIKKCGFKTECKERCSCTRNGLPCTPLCKRFSGDCGKEHSLLVAMT